MLNHNKHTSGEYYIQYFGIDGFLIRSESNNRAIDNLIMLYLSVRNLLQYLILQNRMMMIAELKFIGLSTLQSHSVSCDSRYFQNLFSYFDVTSCYKTRIFTRVGCYNKIIA